MPYKVIEIEGVGETYAGRLIAAGIKTAADLLEKCAGPAGRKALAEQTGIPEKFILKWANHADLFRVDGVGPQFAEVLEAAGVDTVKEFRHRKPENLELKIIEVNNEKHLVRRVPTAGELRRMIDHAATLIPVMSY